MNQVELKTTIIKMGEFYSLWRYKENDFFSGRFGCTLTKDVEKLRAIVGDVPIIDMER